jgi:hypothetical protein
MQSFMKLIPTIILLVLLCPQSILSYTDESHYSTTFETIRHFRVFTPLDYDASDHTKRYPVIYYFHGCGGSYQRSGKYKYRDYGLTPPVARGRKYDAAYEFSNNADFENTATSHDVIIISVDGKIAQLPPEGCGVYFPSQVKNWQGNYYNFSMYIRELIEVVDSRYHTKPGTAYRAVTGLSMGGHMAAWIAATNPHLFSSASQFCYSPSFYRVGDPAYQTTVDLKELWRNLRGLPFRHSTTDRDYLRYYTEELYSVFSGAGFDNEFYLAEYCHHAAARIDLQFDFHLKHFKQVRDRIPCFSHVNLYPDFEIWDYRVRSLKRGDGWIYLNNVTKDGMGIYTRKRLPWGNSLEAFEISVETPPLYQANGRYRMVRYAYGNETITSEEVTADDQGRLTMISTGGKGEEIGIIGDKLQPPVFILTDTVNENIYLKSNIETSLSFDVINLSNTVQTVDFKVSTENGDLLTIVTQPGSVTLPAQSKIYIDSFFSIRAQYPESRKNTAYLKITASIGGQLLDREHIIQVQIRDKGLPLDTSSIKIFDGRSEELTLFKYEWNGWNDPVSSGVIREGSGNGDGKPEAGETFSIWIRSRHPGDTSAVMTWHPVIPINTGNHPDIRIREVLHYSFNTGRDVLSAQMQFRKNPAGDNPIRIPFRTEILNVQPLEDDCHRDAADDFTYFYGEIIWYPDGTISVESGE